MFKYNNVLGLNEAILAQALVLKINVNCHSNVNIDVMQCVVFFQNTGFTRLF